jgi:hypothetical protein
MEAKCPYKKRNDEVQGKDLTDAAGGVNCRPTDQKLLGSGQNHKTK